MKNQMRKAEIEEYLAWLCQEMKACAEHIASDSHNYSLEYMRRKANAVERALERLGWLNQDDADETMRNILEARE